MEQIPKHGILSLENDMLQEVNSTGQAKGLRSKMMKLLSFYSRWMLSDEVKMKKLIFNA